MTWILLLTLMHHNQGSMTTVEFSDYRSCMKAGELMKNAVNKDTPLFKKEINYHCIAVSGVK